MVDDYKKEDWSPENYRQAVIEGIRQRSNVSFAKFRVAEYEATLEMQKELKRQFPDIPFSPPKPPEEYAKEDSERDKNMITSADILDLYLTELTDSRTLSPGLHSRRAEKLATKVAEGLMWGIEFEEQQIKDKAKAAKDETVNEALASIKDKLAITLETGEIIVIIHQLLGEMHKRGILHLPISDLYWQPKNVTLEFLDFLSNKLS